VRVFITGIGMISPLGRSVASNWQRMLKGESNVQAIPESWKSYVDFSSRYYSPLPTINFLDHGLRRTELIQRDPVGNLAIVATQEALQSAGLDVNLVHKKNNQFEIEGVDSARTGVIYGTGWGGGNSILSNHSHHMLSATIEKIKNSEQPLSDIEKELGQFPIPRRYNPFVVSMLICNSVPASIAMKYSINGQVRPVVQACSSGTTAIGRAAELIRQGEMDMVLSGSAEFLNDEIGASHYCFDVAHTLVDTPDGCDPTKLNRPFDANRSGFLFSEGGAASLILESEQSMEQRGAEPLAEVLGYGETFDAYSIMAPDPSGVQIQRMIDLSLSDAGLSYADIDYVNTHGTGTVANDAAEAEVIARTFGKDCFINSTKSILGHTIGASGAIEAIVGVLSLQNQELHPSLNIDQPIADLNFVLKHQKQKLARVFSHSFAFGGHNSGLVLGKA